MTNYYELLEVSSNASTEVIRAAYKAGVKRFHPDNYTDAKDKARATEHLKLLNEALDTLTDEKLRAAYDEELAAEMRFSGVGGSQGAWDTKYGGNGNAKSTRNSSYSGSHMSSGGDTDDLTVYVESLIVRCKNEAEYLDLRDLISKSNAPIGEKLQLLSILDEFTKVRLQQELINESKLEEYRQEVKFSKWGLIFWIIVGIWLSAKFWWAFWVDIALCIIAYRGTKDDRENLSRAEYAAKHIAIYRMRGFKI